MEHILQYILPSILGDFIQGIDKNHMKTNFLSGKVTLQGVSLNPAIVKSLNLPTKMIYSSIGKFEIKIPWLQRLKQPIEIYLEDLFVILEPTSTLEDFDIVEERIKFLEALTKECRNQLRNLNQDGSKEGGSSMDYYKVLILDNMQLTIKDIHVRFENEKKGYAFGCTLDEVNVCTINEKGQTEFLDRTLEENKMKDLFKKLFIQDIGFYWDAKEQYFWGNPSYSDEQKKKFMKSSIMKRDSKEQQLEPIFMISLESHLVFKNVNKPEQEKEPRYRLEIELKPINLNLNNNQVNQMISLVDHCTEVMRKRKRKDKRPMISEEERIKDTTLYQLALTEFLLTVEDPDFKISEEMANAKKKVEADKIKDLLSRMQNDTVARVSKEVILKDEKRRLMVNMEKKMNKKGWFWSKDNSNSKDGDELAKVGNFFDSFIQENSEKIGKNIRKGFIIQLNLKLPECSILLSTTQASSQQSVLAMVKNQKLKVNLHKQDDYDQTTVEYSMQDIELSLLEKNFNEISSKEIKILTKYNAFDAQDLASLGFDMKDYADGNSMFDLKGDVQGFEFKFTPELIITLKRFFKFDRAKDDENFADYAYEKMTDLSKNAQDQIKSLINDYSSTVSISLTWASAYVILPLNPAKGDDSDCWLVSISGMKVFTDPENTGKDDEQSVLYNKLQYELSNLGLKYMEKIDYYKKFKNDAENKELEGKVFPLMEDTKIATELKVIRKSKKERAGDNGDILLNLYIGDISVNLNTLLYKKLFEIKNCFDFSQEQDLNEYMETEKKQIMKNSAGLFKVYFKDHYELTTGWTQYIMVCSGFYLYFFRNVKDLKAAKYVLIKRAQVKVEKDTYDFPHILKITNRYEEVILAFENETNLNKLVQIIDTKNEQYEENNLLVEVEKNELQGQTGEIAQQSSNYNKVLFNLSVVFEGLRLNLFEQFDKRVSEISLWKLGIDVCIRSLDQLIRVQLTDISVSDYTLTDIDPNKPTSILNSTSKDLEEKSSSTKELIVIDVRLLEEKHPEYQKNLNEKELNIMFNTLFINYIPERIYFLIDFFVAPLSNDKKDSNDAIAQDTAQERYYIAKKAENQKEVKFLTGQLKINELSLVLFTQVSHIKLAKATLQRLVMDIDLDKTAAAFRGSLQNIQLFDLSRYFEQSIRDSGIIPYELIGIEKGQSVLEFEFVQRKEPYMKQIKSDVANLLTLNVNSIRLNYVNQPVLRIINYFTNFILDFEFAITPTFQEKMIQAVAKTSKPTFTSMNIKFNNPKIILKSQPLSKVFFELDLETLTIANTPSKNTKRMLKPIGSLEYVFGETYKILTSDIKLVKKSVTGDAIQLSNNFKLDLNFDRCLWYDEYIVANNIDQDEKFNFLDKTFYLRGSLTPIFLKFDQEDFLDIMDGCFLNLAYDDTQDPLYHIDVDFAPELKHMNMPSPINLALNVDYIAGLAMDQIARRPLAKIIGLNMCIGFKRHRTLDKDVEITISKVIVNHFEKLEEETYYTEKTLLGQAYSEREFIIKDEDTVNDIFTPEIAAEERLQLEKVKDALFKLDYKMFFSQDRDLMLNIQQIKVILDLEAIMRIKDFFMLSNDQDQDPNKIQIDLDYKSKSQYKVIIEKAEISIPVSEEATVIVKGGIMFDMIKYDITDIVQQRNDFLESSMININLLKSEIFVFHQYLRHSDARPFLKRSIIFPFSLTYKSKESLSYERTHNTLLGRYDNLMIIDKIVLRLSSTDSMVAMSALQYLKLEFERYKALAPFPPQSKNKAQIPKIPKDLPNLTVINEKNKIAHDGIQIRVINDLSGVSIPLLDFSLHSSRENSTVAFEKSMHLFQGKNSFEISSSFYNSRVSKWEPIIEKWGFILEIDFDIFQEYGKRIDIVNSQQETFNINISDEMLKVVLLTWKEWNESFSQPPPDTARKVLLNESRVGRSQSNMSQAMSQSNLSRSNLDESRLLRSQSNMSQSSYISSQQKMAASQQKMSALLSGEEINDVEYVSPFTIWNDTGYPLTVEPSIVGTHMKGISCKKKLYLPSGDQQDLLMEWNIDRIFEASTKESVLERMKVTVWLEHPVYGTVCIPHIDIHNFGTKKRKLEFKQMKKEFPIICNVFNFKKKKLVRFSSPIVIKNSLPKPLLVQIWDEDEPSYSVLNIAPSSSAALPFDKIRNSICFYLEEIIPGKQTQIFKADSIVQNTTSGIALGGHYALLRSQLYRAYATIFLEPLIIIKNCFPFQLYLQIEGTRGQQSKTVHHILETQDEVMITEFSPDFNAKLRCTTENFMTNDYTLLPISRDQNQSIVFNYQNKKVPLNHFTPASKSDATFRLLISARVCVMNESTENLYFYACNDSSAWVSPFSVSTRNGNEIVLFDNITGLKIRPKSEGSSISDIISLNQLGVYPIDVFDGDRQLLNLGIQVTNVLADRQNNIFTKVILVLPRYIICNKTNYSFLFFQYENGERTILLNPDQRSPFHFAKNSKEKLIKLRLISDNVEAEWNDSGLLDVSAPGNLEFIYRNKDSTQDKFFNIVITIQDASLFITLQEQNPADAAIQLKNSIDNFNLVVQQFGASKDYVYTIPPKSSLPFAWVEPSLNNILVVSLEGPEGLSSKVKCKFSDINTTTIETVTFPSGPVVLSYFVTLQGRSRVLSFYIGKEVKENQEDQMKFLCRAIFPSLGISLISAATSKKCELAYISLTPFMFVMVDKDDTTEIQVRIKSIIIDNNARHDVLYPVILFPQNIKTLRERDLPYLDFVCKMRNRHKPTDMMYFNNLEFYLAETSLVFDASALNAISDFVRSINKVLKQAVYSGVESYQYLFLSEKEKKSLFKSYNANQDVCLSWQTVDPNTATTDFVYIEKLTIQPLMFNLTFKNFKFDTSDAFVFALLKNALGKAIANFDKAPIKLKGIDLRSMYGTKSQIFGTLAERYKSLAKEMIVRIVLSSGIIGNPVKFFDRISSGVNDLVDKPVQGFIEGPIEGGIGIITGAGSLAAKTVGATFNSLHSIADSLANGLSSLTGDDDYISSRERANTKNNSNAITGSFQAVKSVGKGVVGGITGLFEKPIEGGVKGGVGGFMKGMYIGAKGLVIKPVTGVLDGVSKLTQGVSNTFDEDSSKKVIKSRMPRVFYGKERIYKTYDIYHATLSDFIQKKKAEKYSNLTLLGAVFLDQPSENSFHFSFCLILTLERIFFISFERRAIVWKTKSANISEIFTNEDGVQIILKRPSKTLPGRLATIPCKQFEKKAEVYTLLGILYEVVEETLV